MNINKLHKYATVALLVSISAMAGSAAVVVAQGRTL